MKSLLTAIAIAIAPISDAVANSQLDESIRYMELAGELATRNGKLLERCAVIKAASIEEEMQTAVALGNIYMQKTLQEAANGRYSASASWAKEMHSVMKQANRRILDTCH